jgi:tetratricopeptide (TPR) repeat protein
MLRPIGSVLVLCTLLVANVASADNKNVARDAFTEGTRLYDLADFKGALEAFKKAYLNYEDPSFLFNIAQCYRQLNNKPEALRFYRTYLRKTSDPPNTEEVRRLIATLEAAIAQEKAAPPKVTPPPATAVTVTPSENRTAATKTTRPLVLETVPSAPRRPAYKKWWLWTGVGIVAAGAAVGVGLGLGLKPGVPSTQLGNTKVF